MLKNLGEVIKEAIFYHDLTQKELAYRLNMSPQALNGYLNGRTTLKIDDFCKIARILELNPNIVLGFEDCRQENSLLKLVDTLSMEQKLYIARILFQKKR